MKEINVNNMVQGIKQNMSTIRYIRILFIMLALFVGTASEAWAYEKLDPVNGITVYVDKTPSNIGGTIVVSEVVDDTDTDGKKVTLTITPPTGYSISENLITAVPVKNISTTRTGTPDLMEDPLDITGEGSNKYSFVLPAAYTAAYVKVAFKQGTIDENIKFIRSLSEITDPNKQYEMVADIDASGFDGFDFKDANNNPLPFSGTLDGGLFKIKKLSTPLFATINDGTVKNVILEGVNISSGDSDGDAGAICCKAEGASRIYNCGILPTSVVRNDPEDAKKITGFSGSSVSGSRYVGGLVGFLDGTARVINCFSYANITNGTNVGGIVGYNNQTTTSANGNQKTMVMNCMFYGDITGGSNKAPIYNGTEISNAGDNGVGNYNYFWGGASYVTGTNNIPDIQTYNCALLAETRFLQRFEFFRHLQNSHLQLAEWWVTGTYPKNKSKDELKEMMKWVLEPSQLDADSKCPFPILKAPGYYPSVVNVDAENAPSTTERNKGGRLGTLSVSINMGSGGKVYGPPTGATITRSSLRLNITDKDPDHYNFNYAKVQLPYYNDVGTKNYNGYRVVTGWKIVSIKGGTPGSFTQGNDATVDANGNISSAPYNFADRHCTNKDLYSVSGRVFNQGAYWDVPEGVTDIIIEPYWANAAYIADEYADVVYDADMTTVKAVNNIGGGKRYTNGGSWVINGESQKVWKATGSAIGTGEGQINPSSDNTVNDYAIVLVGNVHQYVSTSNKNINGTKKYTVTTIDLDGDNEPDYSFMFRENNRNEIHPLKWDFLNLVGLGMAQKSTGGTGTYNLGILIPTGWFETTNTALFRVTQFEYEHSSRTSTDAIILQGGVMEQWVSYNQRDRSNNIPYIHVGSNVWFKEFHTGCHQDKKDTSGNNRFQPTKHSPISVTGGDFDEFYLTGLYVANAGMDNYADNAECYINGGRFGIVCGAAMEGIGKDNGADNTGNITWQIQNADIDEFYAGGINAAKPVQGNLTTVVEGGYIKLFCGGPKFGDMNIGKTVKTTAKDCTFDTFFGAGYGGNSYSRYAPTNINNINGDYGTNSWNKFLTDNYKRNYKDGYGVSVTYSTQYLPMSNNYQNVARLLVDYVSFSLAKTRDVTSKLKGCTINKNFYGGGNLGMVDGPVTSTLTDCTVTDSVFGAGYSGTLPKVEVRNTGNFVKAPFYNQNLGAYFDPDVLGSVKYTWEHVASVTSSNAIDTSGKKLRTDKDLTTLGTVTGQVTLNIEGTTTVGGCVYGGGAESDVQYKDDDNIKTASTRVNVNGGTISKDVYGGGMGENTVVANDVEVNIGKAPEGNETAYTGSATINGSVYGGSAFGAVNARSTKAPDGNVTEYYPQNGKTTKVIVLKGTVNGSVFGGGLGQKAGVKTNPDSEEPAPTTNIVAKIYGDATVTIGAAAESADPTIVGSVYGGSNVNGVSEKDVTVTVVRGRITGTGNGATFKDGNVHGGGLGQYTLVKGDVIVNVGVETNDTPAKHYGFATIKGDVYGGSAKGNVNATPNSSDVLEPTSSTVKTDVNLYGGIVNGDVYGGGLGDDTSNPKVAANVYGAVTVSMKDGTAKNVFGCNNLYGAPQSTVAVKIEGGTITSNVYGGGNQAAYAGSPTVTMTDGQADNVFGGGLSAEVAGSVTVNIQGGTVTNDVYGGGALADTNTANWVSGNLVYSYLPVTGLTTGTSSVDGYYTLSEGVYSPASGKAAANTVYYEMQNTTAVNLVAGTINGNVYGGGLGRKAKAAVDGQPAQGTEGDEGYVPAVPAQAAVTAVEALVYGNVTLKLNEGVDPAAKGCVVKGKLFGCNNVNGTPKGNVEVHVYATQSATTDKIQTKARNKTASPITGAYDVVAVYGGGNEAAYVPESPYNGTTGSKSQVIIEGCNYTSIETVYGGGNAAAVPESNVQVLGAYEIGYVYGGGNGKDNLSDGTANPGADIGQYNNNGTLVTYGTGIPSTTLTAGYIHEAYGGSNQKGVIKGSINLVTNPIESGATGYCCDLALEKVVGAGKYADIEGDVILVMGCMPESKTAEVFGGADEANVKGNVELTITSGTFGKVFGGNNLGGAILGHIILNIEETGCHPIKIDELYLGGNQAAYSIYGYYDSGTTNAVGKPVYLPRTSASDAHTAVTNPPTDANHSFPYAQPVLNVISCTYIGKVFGGGYGEKAVLYGDPTVNINMIAGSHATGGTLGEIVDAFGGGNAAKVEGNTTVNIGTATKVGMVTEPTYLETSAYSKNTTTGLYDVKVQGANITGNVYGGGNEADITGNTQVNICAKYNSTTAKWESVSYATGLAGVTIGVDGVKDKDHGNVFGGGKGIADNFYCDKAMVGINGAGADEVNYPNGYPDGNTSVFIGNGTVNGSVYGGGEIGRVEMNTAVTIGIEGGTTTSAPRIKGNVFGAGKGLETHGYAALVRGNPIVTIQGNAKVDSCVYGGGEIASVARYQVVGGVPVALAGEEGNYSGYCTVNVLGNAIIGPDEKMVMHHVDAQGNTVNGSDGFPLLPDDAGHVFAAGKGVLPKIYTYADNDHRPKRMLAYNDETISKISSGEIAYWEYSDAPTNKNIWQYFKNETQYFEFIQTLALATQTAVTVDGNAFVKGSVYGGSQNGLVQYDTHVTIDGNCQIGCGKNTTDRHPDAVWGETYPVTEGTNLECASWEYDPLSGAPYDPYAKYLYNGKYYYDEAHTKYAEGGSIVAKDGHTYYGNVFGGGSGSVPYFDTEKGISRYIPTAGEVKRDTYVTISGGHILTNVYGGNEATNVLGTAHVTMTGGTIGVPRTPQQIKDHPVTCYLFGAGKGDQRIFFNKETNVNDAIVKVEGGRIYGSVFGGGEDGHVLRNTSVTIGKTDGAGPTIGTVGSTYVDGNVFGGGRGFGGEALTAGNVGGSVDLTINGGTMLGSIYGGGRLASVGYGLYLTTETGYGVMRDDKEYDGSYPNPSPDDAEIFYNKGRGHITVTVNGGTIGKEFANDAEGEHSGNVFGGSMGRLTKLDGSSFDDPKHWTLLATAKSTTVNINGGTIKRSVYGGGEMGTVTTNATVNVSGGTIGTSGKGGAEFGNVYGGGKGYVDDAGSNYVTAGIIKGNTKVTVENGTNTTPTIYHNIYGGGAYGSVGTFTYDENNNVITGYTSGGKAEIYVTGGTIGTDGKENGMIFGSSRGDIGRPGSIHDKLAWVYDTHVAIGDTATNATITTATPLIKGSIYGGGENGHNYRNAYVRINGGTIGINNNETITYKDDPKDADKVTYTGKDYNYPYRGNVYGGGCGTDKYYSTGTELHDGNGDTYNSKAGIVQGNAIVHISAGNIVRNVYGAGAMGSVGTMTKDNDNLVISSGGKTTIEISGGTVGVDGTDNGNVFGAARGDETTKQTDVALVKTTDVTISGGATVVWGNVYGGGQIGCVGTFTERVDDGKYIWTSDAQNLNGLTKVSITGGETKGHVFGAGKGSAVTFKCEKAMVKKTQVSVSNGKVDKNVYGGGEIGRVEEDTDVKIGVGDGTCNPTISGSVYGAGAGLETHGYSALVRHNTTVTVDGGATIGQSVYGGGEIASVGRYGLDEHKMPEILLDGGYCYVKVQGSATIGSNTVQGNVFGACKGVVPHLGDKDDTDKTKRPRRMTVYTNATDFPEGAKIDATTGNASGTTSTGTTWEYYDESVTPQLVWEYFRTEKAYDTYLQTLALATHPEVTIDGGATVNGSVYGGGEMGLTKGSVMVNILGGSITEDVYGGGALANTNTTSAVGVLDNAGIPQKTNEQYQTTTVYPKTTVNLLGGSMRDAYGGGLGQLALAAQGTEGQTGYQAAVSAIEAKVNGDVKVNLNGLQAATDMNTTILNSLTTGSKLDAVGSGYIVKSSAKGAVVNRVFGCNNLNGTPTKKVQVYVFGTQHENETQIANAGAVSTAKVKGRYDVQAVYGGGNLSPYIPDDALLSYTDENKSKVDAARPEVYIDGCDRTSIKQVYGGGNAAPVPATFVEIRRCYEIDEVFGGGNGFDNYSVEERGNTVWYENSGANVGYYTYATYPKGAGQGTGAQNDPYKAVEDTRYAGGADNKEARLAAKDIQYGSGIARLEVKGGTIHTSYGGSNSKGNVRVKLSSVYSAMFDDCEMQVTQSYGGGKNAYSDGDPDMVADCAKGVKEMFGGARDADMDGNINMLITNGSSLERVFGGNNTSGAVNGSITITLEEGGCEPIKIGELYAGGFLAPYSVYGYEKNEDGSYKTESVKYLDENNVEQTKLQRIPLQSGTRLYNDPRINVISATSIGNIFGGGYQAKLVGNPHINVNMTTGFVKVTKTLKEGTTDQYIYKDVAGNEYAAEKVSEVSSDPSDPEAKSYIATTDLGTIGNIYGGGNMADIVGDTYVEIGTGTEHNDTGELVAITPARNGAKISGNVFGGGKGKTDSFTCEKAMVTGANGTNIIIGNGTIGGTVYGGGEIGRVEANTNVTIGLEEGTGEPVIEGNVFGAGRGAHTHGYAALVRGNTTVTVQGEAKVRKSVYGGGEIASVGKYNIADAAYHAEHPEVLVGMPYSLVSDNKGICNVIVKGNAVIGPEGSMEMKAAGGPDDIGHVFGAGKGVLPYHDIDNHIITGDPWRVKPGDDEHPTGIKEVFNETTFSEAYYTNLYGSDYNKKLYNYLADYLRFIETLALTTQTEVTIGGNAFVKGSVYGGSENGHVQHNTHVTIQDYCQIGHSAGVSRRFTEDEWRSEDLSLLKECASWDYVATEGAPYDPLATSAGTYDYTDYPFVPAADRDSRPTSDGGKPTATDGHTYYGNVFGGGSGVVPYAPGRWHREAGSVGGNTQVDITGGHIMTSVYGGNEQTDVGTYELDPDNDFQPTIPKSGGKCTINMRGGTLGVPRTPERMKTHPVTCYLFGAGKGDQRIFFNTWTNVINTEVNISGTAKIYGSTFGGGEDGHVILNAVTNISGDKDKVIIGTTGTSYVDGNVFGGGRGFSGEAQTAGTVGGNVEVNISGGTMLGSIYGGGRLASVGTLFTAPDDPNYGNFVEDGGGKTYGHVAVNISGGTIGNTVGNAESGNVFGGSMGRLNLLNGNINPIWPKMAQVKETTVTISGDAVIKRNVYGGGELGTVRDNATVNINGGTVNRDVYGAGYGSKDYETKTKITVKIPKEGVTNPTSASDYDDVSYVFTPMIFAGCVGQNTYVNIAGGKVRKSVYGGGEMASVGIMDCRVKKDNDATDPVYTEGSDKYVYEHFHSHLDENNGFALSWPFHFENSPGYFGATHVNITGGRIGVANGDTDINTDNGDVYGGGKGIAGEYKNYVYCANVGSAEVTIDYPAGNTATPQNYMTNADIECIAGAVYGGAENGHVMGDTKLTLKNGLIGHSMYGGGSGKGTFTTTLNKITGVTVKTDKAPTSTVTRPTQTETTYDAEIYSITAGKVFGNTNVVMNGGYVVRNVYGGGNLGSVGKGNYAGGTDDYSYYNNGARSGYGETLNGNLWDESSDPSKAFMNSGVSNVTINGGTVGYIDFTKVSDFTYSGLPYGNVFGGCRGESAPNIGESPRYLYSPTFFSGYVNETNVTIGAANSSEGPKIWGSVYGGGMDGHVRRDATVTINSGEIGRAYDGDGSADDLAKIEWSQCGNVYGAGSGIGQYNYDFNYDGDYEDVVEYTNPETGRASTVKERDFSTSAGSVTRFTKVEVKGGKIHRNVYGGGSLSSVGAPKIPPTREDDPIRRNDGDKSTQGLQSLNEVIISGSTTTIGDATSYDNNGNHVYGGFVFGASRGDETLSNPTSFASSVWTDVKVQGGTIYGDVYGGGEVGTVRQGTEVQLTGGVIGSVKNDKVVGGDVFGGGKGTLTVAADVGGDVLVELNKGVAEGDPGCVVDRIYGANNINGTPKGHVKVHVYATQNRDLATYANITAKKENVTSPEPPASDFDMTGVFGGGKSSDYVPADTDTKQSTEVIIEGCKLTSIYEVYGGGYGASTPGTNVLINGTKIIDKVFGGGYGKSTTDIPNNPGANIGYRTVGKTPYGSHINDEEKIAIVQLKAGKVNSVFGGSNTLGDIRNGSSITTLTSDEAGTQTDDPCEILEVGELYGGGNEAVMEGGAEIVLRCMPDSWIGEVYAGARKADVGNDVSLTITSGKFEQVFGGNKSDGKIDGYVEVNIEECPTCNTPVIIGELYGGGNEAEYTYPELDDDPNYPSPRVNVRAFTSIGTIYGGGKGKDAVVNGNPTVNVSVGMVDGGGQDYSGETRTVDSKDIQLYGHEKGKIGVIGDIFGGGNAAEVNGNTNVFIGTEKYVKLDRIVPGETDVSNYYIRTGTSSNYEYTPVPRTKATAAGTYYQRNQTGTYTEVSVSAGDDVSGYYTRSGEGTEVSPFVYAPVSPAQSNTVYCLPVLGADIQGNVYGGGNAAKVTGHTNVVIGKKAE